MSQNVNLGDIVIDIPPERKIEFVGPRALAKYDVPGYRPGYQDMGQEERTCRFSGVIDGEGALSKANNIQKLMDKGEEIKFLYGEISVKVLIRRFDFQYYRSDRVRYDIELVQVADLELQPMNQVQAARGKVSDRFDPLSKLTKALNDINNFTSGLNHDVWKVKSIINKVIATKNYIVRQGDSLRRISTQLFGTPHKWRSLARLNDLSGPNIPAGLRNLRMPSSMGELLEYERLFDLYVVKKRPAIKAVYKGGGRGTTQ
ncbi:hypothetical protein SCACP_30140 [Sporomusa carbonis]|uniref:LysM peptidoglycan-binding domain-containing protein n=1 Tax=Sporomusa carbonis TaxID=3076075 RepID=UPI003A70DA79